MDRWPWNNSSALLNSDALSIILQHPSFGDDERLVCSLLHSSKAIAAAVAQCNKGRLAVRYVRYYSTLARLPSISAIFTRWLSHNAGLLRSLQYTCRGSFLPASMLAELPTSLTSLEADISLDSSNTGFAALARLTGLQSLTLQVKKRDTFPFIPETTPAAPPLALQRLTALTNINITDSLYLTANVYVPVEDCIGNLQLTAGDQLPPNTQELVLPAALSLTPILALTALCKLSIAHVTSTADELQQLSVLTNLKQLELTFKADGTADAAAAAWPVLPIRRLAVLGGGLSPASIRNGLQQQLCSSLQELKLAAPIEALAGQLAVVLGNLTALSKLVLVETDPSTMVTATAAARADVEALVAAYKKLEPKLCWPSYVRLKLEHMHEHFPEFCECTVHVREM